MTEKSHKKRFLGVIYEIIDGGVALGDVQGTWETPDSVFGEGVPLTVAGDRGQGREGGREGGGFCIFVYILHVAGECTFEAISPRILNI